MTETKSSPRSRHRVEVITTTGSGSGHKSKPSLVIVENNSRPYRRLVYKDAHYRLEISNLKTHSSRKHITVVKVGRRHHNKHKKSSPREKHKAQKEITPIDHPKEPSAEKVEGPAWRRVLDKGLATAKKVFKSSKDDNVPLFPKRQKKFKINPATLTHSKMSSESVPVADEQSKSNAEDKGAKKDPVVVRVVSDHAGKERKAAANGQKQAGGLAVPDDSEKKRRSMETLTAKMDFGDDDEDEHED